MNRSLEAETAALWPTWYGEPAPSLVWFLGATGRPVAQTAVTLYGVDEASGSPVLVAKVNRSRRFRDVTSREYEAQSLAFEVNASEVRGSVARPLGLIDVEGDLHLVSEYVAGDTSWSRGSPSWRATSEEGLAAWLGRLHERTRRPKTSDGDFAAEVRTAFFDAFSPVATVRGRLGEATEMVSAEYGESADEVLVHGDFWSGNWLFSSDSFTVIDWEHAHHSPSPLLDEFLFPLSELEAAEEAVVDPGTLRRFSDMYRRERGLTPRPVDDTNHALLWTAAEVATRSFRRWQQVEDWSHGWARLTERLATFT